jgi:hypothetical protein
MADQAASGLWLNSGLPRQDARSLRTAALEARRQEARAVEQAQLAHGGDDHDESPRDPAAGLSVADETVLLEFRRRGQIRLIVVEEDPDQRVERDRWAVLPLTP